MVYVYVYHNVKPCRIFLCSVSLQASFLYVMCGCLRYGDVDRALEHFRHASERGISLDLPLCESLATALFIKGLRGESTEMAAWNVLDYIRQRGMEHRPEVREEERMKWKKCVGFHSSPSAGGLQRCRHLSTLELDVYHTAEA